MKKFGLFLYILFLLFSCNEKDKIEGDTSCSSLETSNISQINAPSSGKLNTPIDFKLEITLFNGCGSFYQVLESINNKTITVQAQSEYQGCICTDIAPIVHIDYSFTPTEIGEFTFIFDSHNYDDQIVKIKVSK